MDNTDNIIENFNEMVKTLTNQNDLMEKSIHFLRKNIPADGIGIRLEDGDDYPYYTTLGFSDHFIKAENFLCKRDECGSVVRDENGKAILECMCGNIIKGEILQNCPYFSKHGSFFMSHGQTEDLTNMVNEISCITRGRCMQEGYKSVALIPIPRNEKNIGLIQLNSRITFAFTPKMIENVEQIAIILGKAIDGIINLKLSKEETKNERIKEMQRVIIDMQKYTSSMLEKYSKNN